MPRPDLAADGHPVTVGQPDVQHRDVGHQRRDPGQRRLGGAGLADHRDVGLGLQHVLDAAPDDLVVIEQEHPDACRALPAVRHLSRLRAV